MNVTWKRADVSLMQQNSLQTAAYLGGLVQSMLGGSDLSVKVVIEDEKFEYISHTASLLESLQIQHPIAQYIQTVCLAHSKRQRTGTKSLLTMIGYFAEAASFLQDQGIPVPVIVKKMQHGLKQCKEKLKEIRKTIKEILTEQSKIKKFSEQQSAVILKPKRCQNVRGDNLQHHNDIQSSGPLDGFNRTGEPSRADETFINKLSRIRLKSNEPHMTNVYRGNECSAVGWSEQTLSKDKVQCGGLFDTNTDQGVANTYMHVSHTFGSSKKEMTSKFLPHKKNMSDLQNKSSVLVDDEFDDCFGEFPQNTSSVDAHEQQIMINSSERDNNFKCDISHNSSQFLNRSLINRLIHDKISQKNSLKPNILSRSRHFLNVSSSTGKEGNDTDALETALQDASGVNSLYCQQASVAAESCDDNHQSNLDSYSSVQVSDGRTTVGPQNSLQCLTEALSHSGCDITEYLRQVLTNQNLESHDITNYRLHKEALFTQCIVGPLSVHTRLESGLVLPVHSGNSRLIQHMENNIKCVLINGDITEQFRHTGHQAVFKSQTVVSGITGAGHGCWLDEVQNLLEKFDIRLVMCKSQIDDDLRHVCVSNNVLVIDHVPYRALSCLSDLMDCEMLTYISDLTQENICVVSAVEPVLIDGFAVKKVGFSSTYVSVRCSPLIQTLVICHPTVQMACCQEQSFWQEAYRLSNALENGWALPGGGSTENICAQHLRQIAESWKCHEQCVMSDENIYLPSIFEAMATSFEKYVSVVSKNISSRNQSKELIKMEGDMCEKHAEQTRILDDYTSKVRLLESALHTVSVIIQTDMEVTTGCQNT